MDYACTILGRYIVAGDNAECSFTGIHPRDKLFVFEAHKVCSFDSLDYLIRDKFITFVIVFERETGGFGIENAVEQRIGDYDGNRFA